MKVAPYFLAFWLSFKIFGLSNFPQILYFKELLSLSVAVLSCVVIEVHVCVNKPWETSLRSLSLQCNKVVVIKD